MFLKRISKQTYRLLLSFGLALVLVFTLAVLSEAQQESNTVVEQQSEVKPTPTASPTSAPLNKSNASQSEKTEKGAPEAKKGDPSITDINPKELYVDIPQSLFPFLPGEDYKKDDKSNKDEKDVVRLVVSGKNLPDQKDLQPQEKIKLRIGNVTTESTLISNNDEFFASLDGEQLNQLRRGTYPVTFELNDHAIPLDRSVRNGKLEVTVMRYPSYTTTGLLVILALLLTVLLLGLVYALTKASKSLKTPQKPTRKGLKKLNPVEQMLLDRETNSFSLARAQFLWWLTIIIFGFIFLFIGRGLAQEVWDFFPISGFAFTFSISLGTLLGAQVTSQIRGNKGSGEIHPSYSDLIEHGGVIALERVQQIIWNIVVGIAFVIILIGTYATASALPTIPNELLVLMGISSAGYIGGKAVRSPGPNINQVAVCGDPKDLSTKPCLTISGDHLSQGGSEPGRGDSGVIIQMAYLKNTGQNGQEVANTIVEVHKKNITTLNLDPDDPQLFCQGLKIDLAQLKEQKLPAAWLEQFSEKYSQKLLKLTVINADGQKAVWIGSGGEPERESPKDNLQET